MILDGEIFVREPGSDRFIVQTKPPEAQNALWRLVYDNDYHPQQVLDRGQVHPWTQPWEVVDGTGWSLDDPATHGRVFTFNGSNATSRLRFAPNANPTAQTTSDYLVYDQQTPMGVSIPQRRVDSVFPGISSFSGMGSEMPVSDLDLRVTYQRLSGAGPFQLVLTKRGHTFIAEVTASQVSLFHEVAGKPTQIGAPLQLGSSSGPLRIELSNSDYQVTLRVDGKQVAQTTPADLSPNMELLRREYDARKTPPPGFAEIVAEDHHCKISHLSLWRDVYYYNDRAGAVRATPDNPVTLKNDEYFCMGDNSLLSYDGRCWGKSVDLPDEDLFTDAGKVPGRFLLGKAFYVYWPAGYSVGGWSPALVPNFGAMRFIH
jgi:hypothetical protein